MTINGIECAEIIPDTPNPIPAKQYLCRWEDRYSLTGAILGLISSSDGPDYFVKVNPPQRFPEDESLFARSVVIEGHGTPATDEYSRVRFRNAIVTVHYGPAWFETASVPI